ncbi:replicative DNA helicase [Candidatus Riesia sp. GBBU]|nr:replicative DNA helicase [Candidatus Riesia sp. GBBU]
MKRKFVISSSLGKTEKEFNQLKVPPYSIEAEQSVIGGIMLDNKKFDQTIDKIANKDFFHIQHRIIFSEIQKLFEKNQPIDLITLSEHLEREGLLEKIGGFAYLAELIKNTPSAANINAYINIVREKSVIRDIINVANQIADLGYYPQGRESEELLDLAESFVFQIAENRVKKNDGPKNIEEILSNTMETIKKIYHNPKQVVTGVSTGYHDLDKKITGLQNSDLIIIAARPSMGKTMFAMNICEYVSMIRKKPVLIFSLEMPANQIIIRMLSSLSRVEQTKIRTGKLDDEDWARIYSTIQLLMKKKNMYIDDSSRLTPSEIRSRARRIYHEHSGLSLIMIDYLQLMRVSSSFENRTLEIAEISRSLKSLARELKIPVIALSQLNRSLEQRSDKKPVNSDLRESGSIEQDADLIMFIYRDEMYNDRSNLKGIAEIIISKHRNGPTGKVTLTFNGKFSRFDNYTEVI